MRVITVRQPWAWAIVHGGKDVENRTRNIVGSYRGPVAIHAAKKIASLDEEWADRLVGVIPRDDDSYPLAAIIGVVDLVGVHDVEKCRDPSDPWPATLCSAWAMWGQLHLELANPRAIDPIPAKGKLGLWRPDAELLAQIEAAL